MREGEHAFTDENTTSSGAGGNYPRPKSNPTNAGATPTPNPNQNTDQPDHPPEFINAEDLEDTLPAFLGLAWAATIVDLENTVGT